jgi:hypothetical protein
MASEGGSNRVEVMVTVKACDDDPCRFVLNLSRGDRSSLEAELRLKLQRLLQARARRPIFVDN